MKQFLVFLCMVLFVACNNEPKTENAEIADTVTNELKADTVSKYVHRFSDTVLEKKITEALLKLPFVNNSDRYIDSFSNHQHGISFLIEDPGASETEIPVQAGYNGEQRFETYYRFFVDPKTLDIKVYGPAADKKLTVKEYLKTQQ